MCIFCVYWLKKLFAQLHVPPIRASMRDTCMNPDVEFAVSEFVFDELMIMLWINFQSKIELFTRL